MEPPPVPACCPATAAVEGCPPHEASVVVVALPGLGTTGALFPPALLRQLLAALAAAGHAAPCALSVTYGCPCDTVTDMAVGVWRHVVPRGRSPLLLVGFSMGGFVAQCMAVSASPADAARIAGVAFVATMCPRMDLLSNHARAQAPAFFDAMWRMLAGVATESRTEYAAGAGTAAPHHHVLQHVAATAAYLAEASGSRFASSLPPTCRAVVVLGGRDAVVPAVASLDLAAMLAERLVAAPDAAGSVDTVVLPGAQHGLLRSAKHVRRLGASLQAWIAARLAPP